MDSQFTYQTNDFEPLSADAFAREEIARPQTTYIKDVWRSFRKRKTAVFGMAVVCIMVLMVLFAPMMNEFNYYSNNYDVINQAPNSVYWFGTDELGRDLWTRVWEGGRVSLLIAVLAVLSESLPLPPPLSRGEPTSVIDRRSDCFSLYWRQKYFNSL